MRGGKQMDITGSVHLRVTMLGGKTGDQDAFGYIVKKAYQEARDFCNVSEFPQEAEVYLVEWAAAEYLTETGGYSKQWDKMREKAELGLVRFRRVRW